MRRILVLLVIITESLNLISCNGGSQDNRQPAAGSDQESATIALQVDWPDPPASTSISQAIAAIDCSAMNVDQISAQVFSDANNLLRTGGPWDCTEKGGTISNVPARDNLRVRLCAFDSNGAEVYRGETGGVSVRSSQTVDVSISMENVFNRTVSLVQDINPGPGSSFPHRLFELQNQVVFVALDINAGFELFMTGTDGGVQLLRDIYPNDGLDRTGVMAPAEFVELNGWLYFCANDGGGYRLWRTNGTRASTELVTGGANFFNPTDLTVLNDKLFFSAESDGFGRELWVYDDPSGQAYQVDDIYPGQAGSNPHDLEVVGNDLFFAAQDDQTGYEVWVADSAATACSLVADIYTGSIGSYPRGLTAVDGRLLFVASSDGTIRQAVRMIWRENSNLNVAVVAGGRSLVLLNLTRVRGSTLAFSANLSDAGQELYLYDWQTDTAPRRITDLNPGGASSYPANFVSLGDTLYFTASNGSNIEHLWAYSIGQQTLTRLTTDLPYPSPRDLTAVDDNLYFTASHESFGRRLWATDGTRTGLVVATNGGNTQHSPSNLLAGSNGRLYYSAFTAGNGDELFLLYDE
jgi:ELWxxDGT repeat protein